MTERGAWVGLVVGAAGLFFALLALSRGGGYLMVIHDLQWFVPPAIVGIATALAAGRLGLGLCAGHAGRCRPAPAAAGGSNVVNVMLVDFRGCGGSQGDRTTIGWNEAKDVSATLLWVKATLGESAPVLFGHSMGAVAILRAVAVEGVQPRAVIAD